MAIAYAQNKKRPMAVQLPLEENVQLRPDYLNRRTAGLGAIPISTQYAILLLAEMTNKRPPCFP
jgi:hypothetical protein